MKRAPIVLSSTALGMAGLLSYHLATPGSSVGGVSGGHAASSAPVTSATTTTSHAGARTTSAATGGSATAKTAGSRTVTGQDVSFRYGDIQLSVTTKRGRIADIKVVHIDETDPRSVSIDQYAIPQLQQQALAAQSAHIDGVSGASYTSAAYAQSLQSALDRL